MLLAVIFCLVASVLSATKEQPPGCPLPTGPYVPPKCGDNKYFEVCSFKCPPQTCSTLWFDEPCDPGDGCCKNECRCNDGYLKDDYGNCIPKDKCTKNYKVTEDFEEPEPSGRPYCIATCAEPNPHDCDYNATHTCRGGYVFNEKGGECIDIEKCPQDLGCNGDENAVINKCPSCQLTCASPDPKPCLTVCLGVGCTCKKGFIFSGPGGKCITQDQCPAPTPKPDCIPTCAEPNPQNCENNSNSCDGGYVLSEKDGKCIHIKDCPQDLGCNGNKNSVITTCPPPCPSTCYSPNQIPCKRACLAMGCACKPGFILTGEGGYCIEPNKCPDGHPCGINGTFVSCKKECPDEYCSKSGTEATTPCAPQGSCLSGCECKPGYKRTNTNDHQCILAKECPDQ